MKTILLAAGYATRLYPLTENFPKPLLNVGGKPILDWLIADVAPMTDEFLVVTNHKFAAHFSDWAAKHSEKITVIDDGTETNETRLGAVRDIQLAAKDECDYLVMAGDNVLDFSLKPFAEYALKSGTSCAMCHEENSIPALQKTAVIKIDDTGRILSYQEKPQVPDGNLAVPPFYYYRKQDITRIDEALADGCGFDAPGSFAAWLSRKTPMHAWKMTGKRHDIGDMASYEAVKESYRGPVVF
jgi:glucose-1-phosphate thymidylyltransferase